MFVLFCLALYRWAPVFLLQNHDGQNLYYMTSGIFHWRQSWLESVVFSPIHGMGSTFWPMNPSFTPFLWPFALTDNPGARIYFAMVLAALTIFVASLAFFLALRLRPTLAIAAAWMTFALIMLQTVDFLTGLDPLISIALSYVSLAVLAEAGRHTRFANLAWVGAYLVSFTMLVLSHPAWHVIGLPLLLAVAGALIGGAGGRTEVFAKLAAVSLGFAIQYFCGSYEYLGYLFSDTARVLLPDAFEAYQQGPYLAGHLFRDSPTEILSGMLLIIGLTVGRLRDVSAMPRLARAVTGASITVYASAVLVGLWFLYSGRVWTAPKPSYMLLYAYPLAALFVVLGIRVVAQATVQRRLPSVARSRSITAGLTLATFLTWHVFTTRPNWMILSGAVIVFAAAFVMLRLGLPTAAALLLAIPFLVCLWNQADVMFSGRGRNPDAVERMAIRPNPITDYLSRHTALVPGSTFRGYADDAYARPAVLKGREDQLISQLITTWAGNWQEHGNGMKLFNWNMAHIPTLTAYSPYITPLYFYLFAHLLNDPQERHTVNYLTITRPDPRILQLLGLRYLVADQELTSLPGTQVVSRWKEFRIYELPQPNLASYTPTDPIPVVDAAAAVAMLREPGFNPRETVLVAAAAVPAGLVAAPAATLSFVQGGFVVEASSPGRSLIVIPIHFTHCFSAHVLSGDKTARLLRVNLVQTGLLFEGSAMLQVRRKEWPMVGPHCKKQDYADSARLLSPASR